MPLLPIDFLDQTQRHFFDIANQDDHETGTQQVDHFHVGRCFDFFDAPELQLAQEAILNALNVLGGRRATVDGFFDLGPR